MKSSNTFLEVRNACSCFCCTYTQELNTFSSLKLQLLSDIHGLHTTTYGRNLTLLVGQTKRVFQCHCETMLRIRELSHSPPPPLRVVQLHANVMREFFKIRAILCFLAGLCSAPHYFARTNTHLLVQ